MLAARQLLITNLQTLVIQIDAAIGVTFMPATSFQFCASLLARYIRAINQCFTFHLLLHVATSTSNCRGFLAWLALAHMTFTRTEMRTGRRTALEHLLTHTFTHRNLVQARFTLIWQEFLLPAVASCDEFWEKLTFAARSNVTQLLAFMIAAIQ